MIGKRSSCQDQVGSIANDDAAEVPEALEMRRDANSLAHLVRAVRGPCEPGSFESLAFGGCRTTFVKVRRRSLWRWRRRCTSRGRRMAMLAGARSQDSRLWDPRYRHAFGGWFERGRLNLRAGEEPFLRDRREVTEGVSGRFRRCGLTGTKRTKKCKGELLCNSFVP